MHPFYRIIVSDSRDKHDGRFLEEVGTYNPSTDILCINEKALNRWLKAGAQPTETVIQLLSLYDIKYN